MAGTTIFDPGGCGCGTPTLPCSPCPIPKKDLTISWTNIMIGPGSAVLHFTPPGQWNSSCVNQLFFQLVCPGLLTQFSVTYFLSGACPTGQSQTCISNGFNPFALKLSAFSCSPLMLRYTFTSANCPAMEDNGYTAFIVTE